jgi:hypothetical protein
MSARGRCAWALAIGAAGCSNESSIALTFPNEVARSALRRLVIEAHDPDSGAASRAARDCSTFLGQAAKGERPLGMPVQGSFECKSDPCAPDWYGDKELTKVESGKRIVYVLGFASIEEGATPYLEGCSDRFDSTGSADERTEVPIDLGLVIPTSARLVKAAGDRQVGRAGDLLGVPLTIRVEADPPSGSGGSYPIPGVPLVFTSKSAELVIQSGDGTRHALESDRLGIGAIQLRLPDHPIRGEVDVEASALEATLVSGRARATFTVSVTAPIALPTVDSIVNRPAGRRSIGAALGQIIPGGSPELAVLDCEGPEAGCRAGTHAVAPFGRTTLTVHTDLTEAKTEVPVEAPAAGLGILPAGIIAADLTSAAGDELAIADGRRASCQSRTCAPNAPCACYRPDPSIAIDCPCEGAEVLLLSAHGPRIELDARRTMTGSNAVGLAAVAQDDRSDRLSIVIAAQGRSKHERPCAKNGGCMLPWEGGSCDPADPGHTCGCPPRERCECYGSGCEAADAVGICVAQDKMLDQLGHRPSGELYNRFGCQQPRLVCDKADTARSTCDCLDSELGNTCSERDGCGCRIPDQIRLGESDSPLPPNGVAAGALRDRDDWDLVVPTLGGIGLVESKPSLRYDWSDQPIINATLHAAAIAQMDGELANEGPDSPADVVWYSRDACTEEPNFVEQCPIWQPLAQGKTAAGCLGIYSTAGARSLLELDSDAPGACRRHLLEYAPDGLCLADFNADDAIDVAVASRALAAVQVFAGDGRGGLLDPPESIDLPGGMGGPMVCGDVDGDGRTDVVVLEANGSAIHLIRSGS